MKITNILEKIIWSEAHISN